MPNPTHCPECGNPIPPDSPGGHCPNCLLQQALSAGKPEGAGDSLSNVGSRPASESDITAISGGEGSARAPSAPAPPGKTVVISAADTAPAPVGTKVRYLGDYEILEEIARGGMGVVYKARQVSLNRVVAVKMILAGHLAGEAEVKRFHTEAEAAANLQHPNIVAIHEVGQHQGQHYFSMDYVNGPNLAKWAKTQAVSPPAAARLVMTLARAVHFAHQRGTLHRDLKPHNILIDESGQPRITDFGLAKRTSQSSQLTLEGSVMGSPSYMPPEQALGRQDLVGPASDVYALGAILYELLTGRPPFGPGPFATVLRQVVESEPAPPARLNAMVPADLETICLKCLEKRAERRYSSARDLAEELERFLNQEPILARPASAARKTWSWLVRNPWLLVAVSVTLVLGLTGLAYGLWEQNRCLVWVHSHPTESLGKAKRLLGLPSVSFDVSLLGFFGGLTFFCTFLNSKQRGIVLGPRWLWGYAGIGTLYVLGSIVFCAATIHDQIWRVRPPERSDDPLATLLMVLLCAWIGGLLLFYVVREFRIRTLGLQPANEAQLFPPVRRAGKFSTADRREWNLLLATVLAAVWLYRLLFPNITAYSETQLIVIVAAAAMPMWLGLYRRGRQSKTAARHVPLWLAATGGLMGLGYVAPWDEANHEVFQRLAVIAVGLGVGTVFSVGLGRLAKARNDGALSAPEEAWFEWWANNPKRGEWLNLCFYIVAVGVVGGFMSRPALPIVIAMLLPHEFVCLLRSKGLERQGRLQTVLLLTISACSVAVGLPLELALPGTVAGLVIGLLLVAFLSVKSKNLTKA